MEAGYDILCVSLWFYSIQTESQLLCLGFVSEAAVTAAPFPSTVSFLGYEIGDPLRMVISRLIDARVCLRN